MKRLRESILSITCYLLSASLLLSCSDDDTPSPSLTYDFVEAVIGSDSCVSHIRTDRGNSFAIEQQIMTNTSDSIMRCIASYVVSPDSTTATVYGIEHIYSQHPIPASEFNEQPKAPVKLQSWWQSGNYVNMIIGVLTTGHGTHAYAFCDDSPTLNPDGTTTANITLLHKRPEGDAESYTEQVYLSIPLERYRSNANSISVSVITYEGEKRKTFTINNNN